MVYTLLSLIAGVILLFLGVSKTVQIGYLFSTISIGISFGLFLFSLSYLAFGKR